MIALSDEQLAIVMTTDRHVPVEKCDVFLQRLEAILRHRGRFNEADVADAAQLAMRGLIQQPAA